MGEWRDLGAALESGAAVNAGEAYRIFMRASLENYRLFGREPSDLTVWLNGSFLPAKYGCHQNERLPVGIYEDWWAEHRIRLIDPDLPGFAPLTDSAERLPAEPVIYFMPVSRDYIARVYAAYNRLRHYQVAGSDEGMKLRSYRCMKQFNSPPASVWDAYLACWDELAPDGYGAPRAGIGFRFSRREASGSIPEAWFGLLDVCVPSFRLRKPSGGVVFSREAFLCPATMGVYDMNWRSDPHEYLNFAGPGGYSVGDGFEFIPDVLTETADGGRNYITGSYRLPDLPEPLLRAADPHTGGSWGYALLNGWEYEKGFILRREYTDQKQYLNIFTG